MLSSRLSVFLLAPPFTWFCCSPLLNQTLVCWLRVPIVIILHWILISHQSSFKYLCFQIHSFTPNGHDRYPASRSRHLNIYWYTATSALNMNDPTFFIAPSTWCLFKWLDTRLHLYCCYCKVVFHLNITIDVRFGETRQFFSILLLEVSNFLHSFFDPDSFHVFQFEVKPLLSHGEMFSSSSGRHAFIVFYQCIQRKIWIESKFLEQIWFMKFRRKSFIKWL